jgi:hypothetical protein
MKEKHCHLLYFFSCEGHGINRSWPTRVSVSDQLTMGITNTIPESKKHGLSISQVVVTNKSIQI